MAKLKIYNQIVDEEEKVFLSDWYGVDSVCYKDIPEFLDSMEEGDNVIDIRLHCPGGDCIEGWAIYDALRNSGKEITATVEGECSSMATVILLAAPKERRFAYANARMCIHNPEVAWLDLWSAERLTADEIARLKGKLDAQQKMLYEEQERIVNLYVDRTGAEREVLESLMKEDKFVDMTKAVELGFIASTLAPNTASTKQTKTKTMSKEKITIENRVVKRLLALAGIAKVEDVKILDQKITAADGTEFTVEREEGDPQVGDKAYPNGTYVLDDGTTVVVEDEIITSITDEEDGGASTEEGAEGGENAEGDAAASNAEGDTIESLKAEVASLTDQVNALTEQVSALSTENDTVKSENESVKSEYQASCVENATLKAEKEELATENEALKAEVKTDEEKAILDIVAKAGGREWLDALKGASSTFNAKNRSFVEHGAGSKAVENETTTQRLIREQRERQEAKRKK